MEIKKWLNLSEASKYLSRCNRQVIRYVEEGTLKGYQKSYQGKWLFDIKDLDAFVMYKLPYRKLTKPQKEEINVL
jgi:hypothetical protein